MRPADGAAKIAAAFAAHDRRAALMPYLMGGYPDVVGCRAACAAAIDAGADLLELGIPFSDPLADGPVIHAAGTAALEAGVRPDDVFGICATVGGEVPVVLMVYANTVLATGSENFPRRAAAAGAAGLIVPDMSHEETEGLRVACDAAGIALVPLVAPTTPPARLAAISADARGFVYTVSLAGTTGERAELAPGLADTVARVRAANTLPVAVGFGVSTAEQASTVADLADGVIVGSRFVRESGEGGASAVGALTRELAEALQ